MSKARFEVDSQGMRALHEGREPWRLVKELISNAFDEDARWCSVLIDSAGVNRTRVVVTDDGPGFANIADTWTLMGHTKKRSDPTVRGRFNIGEKEILSVAVSATITTGKKRVRFPERGGRIVGTIKTPVTGAKIECILPWSRQVADETTKALALILPPRHIGYHLNGKLMPYREPVATAEATLETVIQDSPAEPLRRTRRRTTIELHPAHEGMLFEMGIPIQDLECPYLVNVMQKVPLPPNRDIVKDSYLQDIYALVLNATAGDLHDEQSSDTWVRVAVEDKDITREAVQAVMDKRYGDRVALWSSDYRSNEAAQHAGYEIVHPKTLSPTERASMEQVGLQHTSDIFPTSYGDAEPVLRKDWTPGMVAVEAYAKRLYEALYGKNLVVSFVRMKNNRNAAWFSPGSVTFNLSVNGPRWFEGIRPDTTSLLIHEYGHNEGNGHDAVHHLEVERLAGMTVHLALERPEIFRVEIARG